MPVLRATAAAVVFAGIAHAQDSAENILAGISQARAGFSYSAGMDFETGNGELQSTRFDASSFLSKPISLGGDWSVIPMLRYRATILETDGAAPGFPLDDETLHQLGLQGFLVNMNSQSPWIYGLWGRASLATDFQHIDGDDFTYDLAVGAGYRINKSLIVGLGVGVFELNGDTTILGGPGFDWQVNDKIHMGLYGDTFSASWHPSEDWVFSLRAEPGGGTWNIDGTLGRSERLDFRSYLIGVYAERRICDNLWFNVGAGVSAFNRVELGSTSGITTFKDHPDEGWFVYTGVKLMDW